MALPKIVLSILEPQSTTSKDEKESKNFIRYGESERRHVSPYIDPQSYAKLHSPRRRSQSLDREELNSITPKITPSPTVKMNEPPTPSQPRKHRGPLAAAAPPAKKIKQEPFYDDVDRLMESPFSPLYKDATNLKLILNHPLAQSSLERSRIGNQVQVANYDEFATAAAAFKDDGRSGRHDPEWFRQAQAAADTRKAGGFRDYEDDMFKKHWASQSRELSEEDDEKEYGRYMTEGCDENTYKKLGDDDYEDDGGAGSSKGKILGNGHTQPTSGDDINYGHENTIYSSTSDYTNDSKQGYKGNHVVVSNSTTALMYGGFVDRSIKLPDGVADWEGRGYCDNLHSIYPDPELLV